MEPEVSVDDTRSGSASRFVNLFKLGQKQMFIYLSRISAIAKGKRKAVDYGLTPTRTNLVFHHFTEKDYKRTKLGPQVGEYHLYYPL